MLSIMSVDQQSQKSAFYVCCFLSQMLLQGFVLKRIVIEDESWMLCYTAETKQTLHEWRHKNSPQPKKMKSIPLVQKIMLMVFFNSEGVVYIKFISSGTTINTQSYCETLQKLHKEQRPRRLSDGVLHDNTHLIRMGVAAKIQVGNEEMYSHPPYNPATTIFLVPSSGFEYRRL